MIRLKRKLSTKHRLIFSLVSALLLSSGWLGAGGLPLFVAFVPLMLISAEYDDSLRNWFRMLGWATLTFMLWNAFTIWWVWKASPLGPITAAIISTWWNLVAFMLFHTVSKRAPKGLAYVLFVSAWIATEYIYTQAPALSFPWLVLGNGFSDDTWSVQWYEYTGVFGGSLWVLVVNILALQSLLTFRKGVWIAATAALLLPMGASLVLYAMESPEGERYGAREKICVSAIQPDVDCYDKFNGDTAWQQENLLGLLAEVPDSAQFVLMPETSLGATLNVDFLGDARIAERISGVLRMRRSPATVIAGCETVDIYGRAKGSPTARCSEGIYYDLYNSAIGIDSTASNVQLHHKGKLVVGVETTPAWLRDAEVFSVDLGGTMGQLGIGTKTEPFVAGGVKVAPAICYEGLYGNYMGGFVRNGAQALFVISNDGWWGNTPGHKFLFSFCRLRAIEHRRDIARSANTGVSGFIDSRGDDIGRLGWDKRGVITADIRLNDRVTFYTRFGDYIGRLSLYIAALCLLYFVAYRAKKRFYLVD